MIQASNLHGLYSPDLRGDMSRQFLRNAPLGVLGDVNKQADQRIAEGGRVERAHSLSALSKAAPASASACGVELGLQGSRLAGVQRPSLQITYETAGAVRDMPSRLRSSRASSACFRSRIS